MKSVKPGDHIKLLNNMKSWSTNHKGEIVCLCDTDKGITGTVEKVDRRSKRRVTIEVRMDPPNFGIFTFFYSDIELQGK